MTCFRDGTVTLRKNRRATGYTESLKEIGYQGVRKGDLVIHVMDAFAGSMGVSDSDGKSTPVYSVCVPRGSEVPWYFAYQLRQMARAGWLQALSKGIRERSSDFRFELFGMQTMLVPPPDEQHLIVRYLRALDAKVKRYIRTKRKLIAALQEQKQAIIQRAVTRGLNPNVKLKPSGVEWLGEVPEHWEVIRLRYLGSKFGSGVTPRGGATAYQTQGIPLLRSQNVHFDGLRLEDVALISNQTHQRMSGSLVKPGDVLLNITGASIGRTCVVPPSLLVANVNQHVCIIRPRKQRLYSEYLSLFLSTTEVQREIRQSQNGSSREGLSLASLKGFSIPVPSLDEQQTILKSIEVMTSPLTRTLALIDKDVNAMQEYHTRLIADVVTGAVDVTAAAKALPDDQIIGRSEDQMMEEEPLSMAAEGEAEYGEE